jgi:hypothetical protein
MNNKGKKLEVVSNFPVPKCRIKLTSKFYEVPNGDRKKLLVFEAQKVNVFLPKTIKTFLLQSQYTLDSLTSK